MTHMLVPKYHDALYKHVQLQCCLLIKIKKERERERRGSQKKAEDGCMESLMELKSPRFQEGLMN